MCHDIFLHLHEMLESRKAEIYYFPRYPSVLSRALFLDNFSRNSCIWMIAQLGLIEAKVNLNSRLQDRARSNEGLWGLFLRIVEWNVTEIIKWIEDWKHRTVTSLVNGQKFYIRLLWTNFVFNISPVELTFPKRKIRDILDTHDTTRTSY